MEDLEVSNLHAALSELPLTIERVELEALDMATSGGWTRKSTVVHLHGGDHDGQGEDVTYQAEEQEAFQARNLASELAGSFTLASFSRRLDALRLFPRQPADTKATLFRRWAFESAALDLALRQAGRSLASVLGREPKPLTFVVSTGLGDPASLAPLERVLKRWPEARFKIDFNSSWTPVLVKELAATGAITTVDLKGHYHGPYSGPAADADLYRMVAEGLPDAWLEDPGWTDATREALAPHLDRVTWDAPISSLADLLRLDVEPKVVNVKPSRFGFLAELLRFHEYCEARGIACYAGGQFELGVGRGQAQLLASLFHAEADNDLAPGVFNRDVLPDEVPVSPLKPSTDEPGFRWS
ncbi:MAG: hypothetical protein AAF533_10585 [Acidobacteriota bacterium]